MSGSSQLEVNWTDPTMWVGAAFVLVHALLLFNTPPTCRSETTFRRFWMARCLYGVAVVLGWGALTFLSPAVTKLVVEWPDSLNGIAWPFATALVATSLVQVPGIASLDARIRAAFHQFARVTEEANALVEHLRRTPLVVGDGLAARVRVAFEDAHLNRADAVFGEGVDARTLWTRVTALKLVVSEWQDGGPFQRFYASNRAKIGEVMARYASLEVAARRTFVHLGWLRREGSDMTKARLMAKLRADITTLSRTRNAQKTAEVEDRIDRRIKLLGALDSSDPARTLGQQAADVDAGFAEEIAKLERSLLGLVARATLAIGRTPRVRRRLLRELGFLEDVQAPVSLHDRLTGLCLLFLFWYPCLLIVRDEGSTERLPLGLTIACVYAAAILLAIYPKRWAFFQKQTVRPIRAYLVSALLAATAWVVAFASLWSTVSANGDEAIENLTDRWPWLIMAATTAFVTSWSADNAPRPRLRWLEAAGQAAVTAVAAVVVIALLPESVPWPPDVRTSTILVNSTLTGALIGFFVPTWYRAYQQERESILREPTQVGSGVVKRLTKMVPAVQT